MSTYLVPVDFSKTADHAAKYAARLSFAMTDSKIILLNAYYVSEYESILPTPDLIVTTDVHIADEITRRMEALEKLKSKMLEINPEADIEVSLTRETLLRSIIDRVNREEIGLIIIGSNGKRAKDESDIGSNAIKISKSSPVPVLVVPPKADYQSIRKAILACDFKKVKEVIPMHALKNILSKHALELLVLNINSGHPVNMQEEHILHEMLKDFSPAYHYADHPDMIKGIVKFAKSEEAQLIIALPKKYSFFESLLHESVSQKLTIKSHVPVLLLKD
ncbi:MULTISPECIES: universal stress protein [unclassified Pedobacter]|uniref:universal stress protein n=1 Tax=unclassified Pedobacter TaxID=2628915 RepID=UPI0014216E05|nr:MULTISPECIES: universal stress protein [unclassified Pedobacter]NII81668.1 nucleotide-binding universal stress UspA family protein [Pedobacter sp. SG908]NMN35672.1 nucleotide-binding universal stress UspA family protein [Pedobacter sp. SG918]